MTIQDKALTWWAEKTKKGEYVATASEIADQRERRFLVKKKLLHPVIKGYWILKRPEDDIADVFPLLYWDVVAAILAKYEWSIRGLSALSILSGEQGVQRNLVVSTKQKTNWQVTFPEDTIVSLRFDSGFDERLSRKIEIAGRQIPVDLPEKVLIDISKEELSREIRNFIAGTKFDFRVLEALYAKNPKPVVFKRLVRTAKEAGRLDLASRLEQIIETYTHYNVGKKEAVAPDFRSHVQALKPPWVLRQEAEMREFEEVLNDQLADDFMKIKTQPIDRLLKIAKDAKKYDTYHSTTLEGYRITPEEVEVLLSGRMSETQEREGESLEKIQNRMAIVGYAGAFDFVLERAKVDHPHPFLSQDLIKDTYYQLFKPTADAGIIDPMLLVRYRTNAAFIRGTRYVPPSYEKLEELMASFESIINDIGNPIVRAILAHYLFVAIHPYGDGNGRTARLIMNYLLISSGYPWVTIRADQRIEYFEALKKGQLESDILPFGKFIVSLLEEATR